VGGVEDREEDLGREVGDGVGVGDTPGHERGHGVDMAAVEILEELGVFYRRRGPAPYAVHWLSPLTGSRLSSPVLGRRCERRYNT
jgi:hypothetical protein